LSTLAYSSQGTDLKVTISGTPTLITQIVGITGPSIVTDLAEITNLSSPNSFKEWKPILKDGGNVSFDLIFDAANAAHVYLQNANINSSLEVFTEDLSTTPAQHIAYSAYVTKFEIKAQKGQVITMGVELKVTGNITIT
jgi:hypothetical protein